MAQKKKIGQSELRKLMSEQKKRVEAVGITTKKIESPLAKYDAKGQLTCIVCSTMVRGEAVWNVHINSKNHRENIAKKAKRKESPVHEFKAPPPKKPAIELPTAPPVRLRSILKNSDEVPVINVPADFFEASKTFKVVGEVDNSKSDKMEVAEEETNGETVPEGFFDDPKLDAKVRNVEYKDPVEEEWEQFQKVIKEETSKAQQIISEDQEEATTERQIDEIDEQLRHWSRVVTLEKKKEETVAVVAEVKTEVEDDFAMDEDFDEFLDWRSKASF